jgi:transcriptional antiterminator NusG
MERSIAGAKWYAMHVRSRAEKYVALQLEAKQYEVFLPLYRSRRRWRDRWKTILLPLFSGYLFCNFDAADRYSVLATSGLIDIVRTGHDPAPVELSEIEAVRRMVDSPLALEPYAGLVRGQRVTLQDGPLRGLSGTLMEVRKGLRLVVSVELLKRSVLAEIERDWVAACGPAYRFAPAMGAELQ